MTDRSDAVRSGRRPAASDSASSALLAILTASPVRADLARRVPDLIEHAERHGVLPLVSEALRGGTAAVSPALDEACRRHAMADVVREAELVRMLAALDAAGVPALVFKGAQLAYTVYDRPDLRPRLDSDLLVRPADRAGAHDALAALGYEWTEQFTGDLIAYQSTHVLRRDGVVTHVVDLHWRIANPQQFGLMIDVGDLFARSTPLARLGRTARGLGAAHALFISCVHPVAHHAGADRLIWSWDLHLLVPRMETDDWTEFVTLALRSGAARVCARSLELARDRFGTLAPERVRAALQSPDADRAGTAPSLFSDRRHIRVVWSDFQRLGTWRNRWQFVRQHLFPPPSYMRGVYAPASAAPLPVLYARRALRGAMKWLARP